MEYIHDIKQENIIYPAIRTMGVKTKNQLIVKTSTS